MYMFDVSKFSTIKSTIQRRNKKKLARVISAHLIRFRKWPNFKKKEIFFSTKKLKFDTNFNIYFESYTHKSFNNNKKRKANFIIGSNDEWNEY